MKITFLIGNGFDLGIGMKSSYKDFYPFYIEKSAKKEEKIKMLSKEISSDYKTWADFELALGKYVSKFTKETAQNLIDQIKDFEKEFMHYLSLQENSLIFDQNKDLSEHMLKALREYYKGDNLPIISMRIIEKLYAHHFLENHTYNFINFNYTTVLEKCLKTITQGIINKRKRNTEYTDKIGTIIYIHGKCDMNPIIGVNDSNQIDNTELAENSNFSKYIIKPIVNNLLRNANDSTATEIINTSTIICIYGMSIGETDKIWWHRILSWLNNNKETQLIVFDYDKDFTQSNHFDRLQKEDALIEKLSKYSTKIDVENLRDRIHLAIQKNIFEFDLSDKKSTEETLEKIHI